MTPEQTNIAIFRITSSVIGANKLTARCLDKGVRIGAIEHDLVRVVMHLDVSRRDIERASRVTYEAL